MSIFDYFNLGRIFPRTVSREPFRQKKRHFLVALTAVQAHLNSTSTLTANEKIIRNGSASLNSTSTLTANEKIIRNGSASLNSISTLTAKATTAGNTHISSTSTVVAVARVTYSAVNHLTSTSSMTARANVTYKAVSHLTSTSTLTASSSVTLTNSASLHSTSTVIANGIKAAIGSVHLSSTSTITANGTRIRTASATLSSTSSVSLHPSLVQNGRSSLHSTSSLSAIAQAKYRGSVSLHSISSMLLHPRVIWNGRSSLHSTSSCVGHVTVFASASLHCESRCIGGRIIKNIFYTGSGLMTLSSVTTYDATDEGTIQQNILVVTATQEEQGLFAVQRVPIEPLPLQTTLLKVDCCSTTLPNVLQFRHNLNAIDSLNAFLKRNGLSLPGILRNSVSLDFIKLNYSKVQKLWIGKVHLTGQSPFGSYQESWDISVQFGCDSKVNSGAWRFSVVLLNKTPNSQATSRLLAYFDNVCPDPQVFFGFDFNINISTNTVHPTTILPLVLNDEVGFFRNSRTLIAKPNMVFKIFGSIGPRSDLQEIDLSVPYDATLSTGVV